MALNCKFKLREVINPQTRFLRSCFRSLGCICMFGEDLRTVWPNQGLARFFLHAGILAEALVKSLGSGCPGLAFKRCRLPASINSCFGRALASPSTVSAAVRPTTPGTSTCSRQWRQPSDSQDHSIIQERAKRGKLAQKGSTHARRTAVNAQPRAARKDTSPDSQEPYNQFQTEQSAEQARADNYNHDARSSSTQAADIVRG